MKKVKKSKIGETIILTIIIFIINLPAQAKYSGGTGEPDDPYQLATAEDLIALGEEPNDYDKHFILTADIDLASYLFDMAVIAPDTDPNPDWWFEGTAFTGVFYGNDHTISNLTIEGSECLGLFGKTGSGASISNLGLEAVDVNGTGDCVGGLIGYNIGGNITNCYSTGAVTGNGWGIAGLVGTNDGSIAASYSAGSVTGNGWGIGGLVGRTLNDSFITNCYSTGSVIGDSSVGGLVGTNDGSIAASYSVGSVSGNESIGGLVGGNWNMITSSYSTGSVSGDRNVGGLVGGNGNMITSSYSTGAVIGNNDVGGLVGNNAGGSITSSFWNIQTSGQATSTGGTGLTTPEMQDINTYLSAGWDFADEVLNGTCDYWQILQGEYPQFRWQYSEIQMPEGLGTEEQPYLIRDANDLGTVWAEPTANYRLEASLDLTGITWSIAVIPWFNGTFDGNDHTISNLTIEGNRYLGLFGQIVSGANISNLGLEAVDINGTGDAIGGLVGSNDGNITNCHSAGRVTGGGDVGGLVGWNSSSIANCSSSSVVSGSNNVGGLVGFAGDITLSFSTGAVTGNESVGGLVGSSFNSIITNCYSTSSVSGDRSVGGLVGNRYIDSYDNFINCYSTGSIIGNSYVGGLVGDFYNESIDFMKSCFWDIETSGQTDSAGDGIGLTTIEMQTESTFTDAGWDFVGETINGPNDVWTICEGTNYPRFVWQIPQGYFLCPDGIMMDDFDFFIDHYGDTNCDQSNGYCDGTDLDFSGTVDIDDFEILLDNWLKENP